MQFDSDLNPANSLFHCFTRTPATARLQRIRCCYFAAVLESKCLKNTKLECNVEPDSLISRVFIHLNSQCI